MKRIKLGNDLYQVSDTRALSIISRIAEGKSYTLPEYCKVGELLDISSLSPDDADVLLFEKFGQ